MINRKGFLHVAMAGYKLSVLLILYEPFDAQSNTYCGSGISMRYEVLDFILSLFTSTYLFFKQLNEIHSNSLHHIHDMCRCLSSRSVGNSLSAVTAAASLCSNSIQSLTKHLIDARIELYLGNGPDGICQSPCDNANCQDNAICNPQGYGYICQCMPGWSGPNCENGLFLFLVYHLCWK